MKLTFTKLFASNTKTADVNGARIIIISNDQQTRELTGKVGGPMEDGYFVATLRGSGKVTIEVLQPDTTIEVKVTEN